MKPEEMKAKLEAFFERATPADIADLLQRTNYDFYKNVKSPGQWREDRTVVTRIHLPVQIRMTHVRISGPTVSISRHFLSAEHQDLALAA